MKLLTHTTKKKNIPLKNLKFPWKIEESFYLFPTVYPHRSNCVKLNRWMISPGCLHNFVLAAEFPTPCIPIPSSPSFCRCFKPDLSAVDVIDRYRVKRQCSWLQKQGWFWVAKFAGILCFYRKAVVLISATPALSKIADEANARASFPWYPGNWRVPTLPWSPLTFLRPSTRYRPFQFRS